MTKINVPNPEVLIAGIQHAELDLNRWNQASWFSHDTQYCGTTACLAGHILLAQGYSWNSLREKSTHIPRLAMKALGFDKCRFGWAQVADYSDLSDAERFYRQIFGMIREGIENFSTDADDFTEYINAQVMALEPAAFKTFKERITELTGVEF